MSPVIPSGIFRLGTISSYTPTCCDWCGASVGGLLHRHQYIDGRSGNKEILIRRVSIVLATMTFSTTVLCSSLRTPLDVLQFPCVLCRCRCTSLISLEGYYHSTILYLLQPSIQGTIDLHTSRLVLKLLDAAFLNCPFASIVVLCTSRLYMSVCSIHD